MAYYSYKRVRDILIGLGEIIYDDDSNLTPKNNATYGVGIDNTYLGNLYEMIADEFEKLQAENAEIKKQSQWNISSEVGFPKRNCFIAFKEFKDKSIYTGFLSWSDNFSYGSVEDEGEVISLGCIESFIEIPTPPEGE